LFEGNKKPNFLAYLSVLQRQGALRQESRAPMLAPVESWMEEALIEFERFRVLCAINEGPLGSVAINQAIEAQLQKQGWIRPKGEWYSGRAIMLTRNQHDLGLSNGDVGLVVADPSSNAYRAYFLAGSGFQGVSINRLLSVQTAYAMSIHKSQGSEYEHALVVLQDHAEKSLTRELLYTGVTRAKRFLSVFQARSGLIEQSVSMRAKRTSGLSGRLQALSALDN
jgi:exodeoxyribonuclease V alpha subunit